MKRHRVSTKVMALTLSFILLLLQTPISVFANTEITLGKSGEIIEFKPLEEDVRLQNVAPGTPLEDLALPDQLGVTAIVDEEVEGRVDVLEWVCDKEYDPELVGVYLFSPDISSGWALSDYAVKPKITVTISPVMAASASVDIWDGSIATGFAGGDGSEGNPYQISNGAELAYLATNEEGYSGKYLVLTNNIYLNVGEYVNEWTPKIYFYGRLDGNNKTIYGLYINNPSSDSQGLFKYISGGEVINLGIANSSITGKDYVGALAGKTYYGYFNNIYVSNNEINGANYVGGVTGASERVYDFNNMSNFSGSVNGYDYVGGISGGIWGKSGDYTIETLYNNSSVSGTRSVSYVGGIFGTMNDGYLSNSINHGNVTGYRAGGFVGTTHPASYVGDYIFINCENFGTIEGVNVAGIVGNTWDLYANRKLSIKQCTNWGEVNGTSGAGGIVESTTDIMEDCINNGLVTGRQAGGIASSSYGSAVRCYNLGTISGVDRVGGIVGNKGSGGYISTCGNIGSVTGNIAVGGIAGYHASDSSSSQCYNTGDIEGAGTSVGGLMGTNYSPISDCYSTGNVRGTDYIGGLVGVNGAITIANSYSTGKVVGTGSRVGGFIGQHSGTLTTGITNSYYLESAHAKGIGDLGNNVVSGLSPISAARLRFLDPTLGEYFARDTNIINQGYPILVGLKYFDTDEPPKKKSGTFRYGGDTRDYKAEYYYDDDYFSQSSYEYNQHLATMSLCFELSAYGSYDEKDYANKSINARNLLTEIGYSDFETNGWYKVKPTKDSIGAVAANKKITVNDQEYTLIALAVRGGGYESEWASNFTIGREGMHEGFSEARDEVLAFLHKYISDKDISGDIKLWMTGYSRGAATANLVAGAIDDGVVFRNCKLELSDMYVYGFETPAGALSRDVGKGGELRAFNREIYKNIFNIINHNDMVPKVAPRYWSFARYGVDIYLPAKEISHDVMYAGQLKGMLNQLETFDHSIDYIIDDFQMMKVPFGGGIEKNLEGNLTQSFFLDFFVNDVLASDVLGTRDKYVDNYQEGIRDLLEVIFGGVLDHMDGLAPIFSKNLSKEVGTIAGIMYDRRINQNQKADKLYDLVTEVLFESINELGVVFQNEEVLKSGARALSDLLFQIASKYPETAITLITNINGVALAHYPEICLAWMQSMDSNYTGSATTAQTVGAYRILKVSSSVDIEIYNDQSDLVASIISDSPQDIGKSIVAAINSDGEKTIYLPAVADYTIVLTATADGEMSYSINEFSMEAGQVSRIVNYLDIPTSEGIEIVGSVPKYSEFDLETEAYNGSSTSYMLSYAESEEEIEPDSDLSGYEARESSFMITVISEDEELGMVKGNGSRTMSSFAQVEAMPYKGCGFDGWYIENVKVSDELEYRFRVEADVTLVARFTDESEHIPVESIDLNTGALNMLSIGATLQLNPIIRPDNATDKTVTYESNNPAVASVDDNGLITAKKTGTALITATTSNGKVSKTTVRVSY